MSLDGLLRVSQDGGATVLAATGRWDVAAARFLDPALRQIRGERGGSFRLDASRIERLDTTGAWLIYRMTERLLAEGVAVELVGLAPNQRVLLDQVAAHHKPVEVEPRKLRGLGRVAERTGKATVSSILKARNFVAFLGLIVEVMGRTVLSPRRLRFTSTVYHIEQVGFSALPIVGLISFLIGVVMAYQGAAQLQQFGAEVFVVNLISVSVLRELGVLLTAIVVAGRSGSAFTAQIGAMKVNEEVDAMRALGLDPVEVLVLPRVLALMVSLPLLAFFADLMGLLGGGLMSWLALGVTPAQFITRLHDITGFWTVMTGLVKAPVFALLIALVGCYEGLRVEGSAESVGKLTTRSVVEAIFLVIVVDALFSIFFNVIGI